MAKSKAIAAKTPSTAEYTVVARRYRPKQFAELIGQEHVAKALVNALQTGRVAHAYLFTGARGTGKTSAARILAKALNCVEGPTGTPCDKCESCLAVAEGQDVDVVEIDGASNNKVDEARDLRQNVGFRPTRGRYKVYIIDEVHMLSTGAFNALLKTLEEPPAHVKFILATTEIQKIPITILSRCQRFDFAQVGPAKIFEQLKNIVRHEGLEAEDDALQTIARRANGSMRDSQSLLDQLLSSSPGKLTAEHVQSVLGSAGDERVAEIANAILSHDAAQALNLLSQALERGLQLGELTDQIIDYWRSLMLVACGGPGVAEHLPVTPSQRGRVLTHAKQTSLDTVLCGLDILTTAKSRMRGSAHLPVLLEMAVVRLARLEDMLSVSELLQTGASGLTSLSVARRTTPVTEGKKNGTPHHTEESRPIETRPVETLTLSQQTLSRIWKQILNELDRQSPVLANYLRLADLPAIFGPNSLAIRFQSRYNHAYDFCATDQNAGRIQEALRKATGEPIAVRYEQTANGPELPEGESGAAPVASAGGRRKGLMALPMFRHAAESLGAQLTGADDDFDPSLPVSAVPMMGAEIIDDDAVPFPEPDED